LFHATRLHLTVHQKLFTYGSGNREAQAGIAPLCSCRSIYVSKGCPTIGSRLGSIGDESIVPLLHECKPF
jgi:hypothetical protein